MAQAETTTGVASVSPDRRAEQAQATVQRYTTWSIIGGAIPFPVVDIVAVGALQLQMLRRLAAIYDVPFQENLGKSVVASLMGSVLPASAATTTALTFGSALKAIPAIGAAISIVAMPSLAAGATYVIGRVFMQHFASGGTLLDFHAPDYSEFIKAHSGKAASNFSPAPPARGPAEP
jgi:uncharacterized protein (DUF697 family)